MQPLDTCDVLELCVILIIRGSLAIRLGLCRWPAIVQKEQQGIFRCRAGSGYLRQQIRGGRKGRTECQGLGQSPNKITGSVSEWLKEAASKTVDRP